MIPATTHTLISSLATSSLLTVAVSGRADAVAAPPPPPPTSAVDTEDWGVGVLRRVIWTTGVSGDCGAEDDDPGAVFVEAARRLVILLGDDALLVLYSLGFNLLSHSPSL